MEPRNTAAKALRRFMAGGGDRNPRLTPQHRELLHNLELAKNDVIVLERSLRAESERPFDLLAAKMMPRDA